MSKTACSPRHIDLGRFGEEMACLFLQAKGYKVLGQNWRCRAGEIDLVCLSAEEVVFVEVKTRSSRDFGGAAAALDKHKQKRISRAAARFLSSRGWWDRSCRFDMVLITLQSDKCVLEHVINAFEFTPTLGSRHSNWQPW